MIIEHEIVAPLANPAEIEINGEMVTAREGLWPSFGELVAVESYAVDILGERYIYLSRRGTLILDVEFCSYGRNLAGEEQALLDLVAWRDGDDWHVKRLIPAEPLS